MSRSLKIILALIIFACIGGLAYFLTKPNSVTQYFSKAGTECDQGTGYYGYYSLNGRICNNTEVNKTNFCGGQTYCCKGSGKWVVGSSPCTCTNGQTKREDTIWYDCVDGAWIPHDTNCSQTASGSNWSIAGNVCTGPNAPMATCSSQNYCCPGAGKKWVINPDGQLCPGAASTPAIDTPKPPGGGSPKTGGNNNPPANKKSKKPTPSNKASKGCNDNKCQSIAQGSQWGLNNCGTGDPDGDMQLCDAKGRLGTCGGSQLCCPGPGQKWTTDMTACPVTGAAGFTVAPTTLNSGDNLSATWSGIPAPSTRDWIGMYQPTDTDERNPVTWNYVNSTNTCTQSPGDGKADGTCSFGVPATAATGTYELRMFSNDTFSKIATSNTFSVTGMITPTPTINPLLSPTPSGGPWCACPIPTPTFAISSCNGPCLTSSNCQNGQVCLLNSPYGWVCRNPACVENTSCSSCATITTTPTPTPVAVKKTCGQECSSTYDCKTGYQCIYINSLEKAVCRNPKCFTATSCSCPIVGGAPIKTPTQTPTPTGGISKGTEISPTPIASESGELTPTPTGIRLNAIPTVTPTPTPIPINPALTIKPFTDTTGKAPQKFTLMGTSDPNADIDIRFDPDAVGQVTTADAKGEWRYILTKSLTPGNKQLTVTATTAEGGQTQLKQSFTVKSGGSFFSLFLGFLFLAAIGGIGFFIYQKQMNDQSNLFNQFPPISSGSEGSDLPPAVQDATLPTDTSSETPSSASSGSYEIPPAETPVTETPVQETSTTEPVVDSSVNEPQPPTNGGDIFDNSKPQENT